MTLNAQATMAGAPGPITTEMTFELITPALLDRSAQVWMLVVGRRGRGGTAETVLGATSVALLYAAQCPLLIAHRVSHAARGAAVKGGEDPREHGDTVNP